MTLSYADPATTNTRAAAARRAMILWGVRAAAVVAIGLAFYLAVVTAMESGAPAGCGEGSGCEQVLGSKWGRWFGAPVAQPALVVYGAILAAAAFAGPTTHPARRRTAWAVLAGLAALAALAAVWFVALQLFVVKSFCAWCSGLHACGLVIAALVWAGLPLRRKPPAEAQGHTQHRHDPDAVRPRPVMASVVAGAVGVGVLIAGQVASEAPETRLEVGRVRIHDGPPGGDNSRHVAGGGGGGGDGRVTGPGSGATGAGGTPVAGGYDPGAPLDLDKSEHPIIGPATTRRLLVAMNDYTCSHCRHLHHLLDKARERYGPDSFAVMSVPVPLNSKCNSAVYRTGHQHRHACELAKLALAVWRADPVQFAAFDRWLYAPEESPEPEQARRQAALLVGEAALAKAEADPWVSRAIARNAGLYQRVGRGKLPKLFVDAEGAVDAATEKEAELFELFEKELGLKPVAGAGAAAR